MDIKKAIYLLKDEIESCFNNPVYLEQIIEEENQQ